MTLDLVALVLTFGTIFLVELPDKTFLATLVLATRYRPLLVWLGVGAAFAVQTTVAVLLGTAVSFLPDVVVKLAAAALFLIGAVLLFREARKHHGAAAEDESLAEAEEEYGERTATVKAGTHGIGAVVASFLVLFAAEWGDLSQLLTISLVARYSAPVEVFVGALAALLTVSALAVLVGRALLRFVTLHVLFYVGSGVCLLLASLVGWELLTST